MTKRHPNALRPRRTELCLLSGYKCAYAYKHGCKCENCLLSHKERCYRTLNRNMSTVNLALRNKCNFPDKKPSTGYQYGCRCRRCKAGNALTVRLYRARKKQKGATDGGQQG